MSKKLITYGFWFYEELLPIIMNGSSSIHYLETTSGKFPVKINSTRLRTLKHSPMCVACGKVGVLWMLQSHGHLRAAHSFRPHLNLYAIDKQDVLTMMTQDHILPKSRGGTNDKFNLQTMCTHCNNDKSDTLPHEYATAHRHSSPVDGRGTVRKGLSEVQLHALATLASLERIRQQMNEKSGSNSELRSERCDSLGIDSAVSRA